jgi:hypothetical protein
MLYILSALEDPTGDVREFDLCDSCATKLDRFLAGEELEIPP